jgi:asparagine synthase (glutamine-hydrolysing)
MQAKSREYIVGMCGIAGVWGVTDVTSVEQMIAAIQHRGPDGIASHVDPDSEFCMGHCRLAIMDPEGGDQPILAEDEACVLVSNGEIYNHVRLREALSTRHDFSTRSDSEAILHLFEEEGAEATTQLDGMFAVAIADGDSLYLARDPLGIKPLYYAQGADEAGNRHLTFASELKALAHLGKEVQTFPPGSYYHAETGFVSYYDVPEHDPVPLPAEEHAQRIRATLEEAVTKRLMSDVPLGAFLSGGLDSSIIAAIARQHMDELHTFSVGVEGSNDIMAARLVADHIGSTHHEYLYSPQDVIDCLPEVIYHLESYDQDLVRSAIPCYLCSRLAADYVKVILTGEGADELFAGYTYYHDIYDPDVLHAELRRSVQSLHDMNLQRVDRLTMCHGIEGRVPFLDTALVELAQTVPPELKLKEAPQQNGSAQRRTEKWILRKACEDLLPPEIVWRDKEQFDEGSGTVDLLSDALQTVTAGLDAPAYQAAHPDVELRSLEECYYHSLLVDAFEQPQVIVDNVARWTANRLQ